MSLQTLNLKYNPFKDLTPHHGMDKLFWAGDDDIKEKIDRIYKETLRSNAKQVVLNWGPYGGGKTFSAYYFIQKMTDEDNLTHIYIKCPKEGNSAIDELFKSVVDELTFDNIRAQVKELLAQMSEEDFIAYLTSISTREFAKAIVLFGSDEGDTAQLMNRFLYSGLTKTELKRLELAKELKSGTDKIRLLAGLLTCFIGNETFVNGRVVLWIDEMEDLVYYTPKTYKIFSQALRELIDSIQDRFLVFLNFTLSEGEEATIELILGGAVWSRISRKIRYKQFSAQTAFKYCDQLLRQAKVNTTSSKPFEKSIIIELLAKINANDLIPREINRYFGSLIIYCLDHELSEIDQEVINKWMEEYSEDN